MPRTTRSNAPTYVISYEDDKATGLLVSKHLASRLYEAETKAQAEMTCAICLEPCVCPHCATYLQCGHGVFHVQCVMALRTPSCPVCRG